MLGYAAQAPAVEKESKELPAINVRFATSGTAEVPSMQRHVLPLMGRLGCNGRACHGSFQGQGGFRLSLFGYDFKTDHDALLTGEHPRVDLKNPAASLMLQKATATDPDEHGGGQRMKPGTWQYQVFLRWIEAGAREVDENADAQFVRMEVTPLEIVFKRPGETAQLKVVSHWSDGTVEDVTPLCRFQTNDDAVAKVDEQGKITILGQGDTHVVALYDNGVVPVAVLLPVSDAIGPRYPSVPTPTKVDELVVDKLRKLGIRQSDLCTDAEFLRRVSLDITGTLPTAEEVTAFLSEASADKRSRKIDDLLTRPAYAAWWATKLCDVTGNNERAQREQEFRSDYAEQWYRWMDRRLSENMPYDKIVEGLVMAVSRTSPDQTYDQFVRETESYLRKSHPTDFADRETMPNYWSRQNMRTPNEKALSFSYAFLGVRLQCAECHKHPFDQWSQNDFKQFTAFFTRVNFGRNPKDRDQYDKIVTALGGKEKQNQVRKEYRKMLEAGALIPFNELYVDSREGSYRAKGEKKKTAPSTRVITPKVLGGEEVIATDYKDPRQPLMDWLREKDNPYFARAFVNRIWSNYFNVGIVEPVDDMNLANAPSNKELLNYLSEQFIEHKFDIKWLHREITNSRTYQLSWKPNSTNEQDLRNFSHAVPRRMPAEVVYDAVVSATAGPQQLQARQADPATLCAIGAFRGYSLNSNGSKTGYALSVFGKPRRETTCDCERSNEPTLLQTIFLRNDDEMLGIIERRDGWLAISTGQGVERRDGKPAQQASEDQARSRKEERDQMNKQIDELERKVKKASKGKTKDKELVARLTRELNAARQALKSQRMTPESDKTQLASARVEKQPARLPPEREAQLVREAYLRIVGRFPSESEVANAEHYLAGAPSTATGLRDVLWALLNTKEFVVNH
jgi:hypothetical protein